MVPGQKNSTEYFRILLIYAFCVIVTIGLLYNRIHTKTISQQAVFLLQNSRRYSTLIICGSLEFHRLLIWVMRGGGVMGVER